MRTSVTLSPRTPRPHVPRVAAGFTLLELLVVLVIIGLLASYVAPQYLSKIGKSEVQVARAQMDAFGKALDAYRLDVGTYPTTEQGLAALVTAPANTPRWAGPYLKAQAPLDPWGSAYQYRMEPGGRAYSLVSLGRDKRAGGEDEDADLGR